MSDLDIDGYLHAELAQDLQSDDPMARRAAVIVLCRMGKGEQTLAALRKVVDAEPDEETRHIARKGLGQIRERLSTGLISDEQLFDDKQIRLEPFRALLADPNPSLRLEAVLRAIRCGDKAALDPILERLPQEQDAWVTATMLRAIERLGKAHHVTVVQPYLRTSTDPRIVANAIEAVEALDRGAVFNLVVPLLNSKDNRILANAVKALYKVDETTAREAHERMADSPKNWMRESAVYCTSFLSQRAAEEFLLKMYRMEGDLQIAKAIEERLAEAGSEGCLPALNEIADEHRDERRRVGARAVLERVVSRLGLSPVELRGRLEQDRVNRIQEAETEARNSLQSLSMKRPAPNDEPRPLRLPSTPAPWTSLEPLLASLGQEGQWRFRSRALKGAIMVVLALLLMLALRADPTGTSPAVPQESSAK